MSQSLKYSNAVRVRVIDTAIKLLCKAGCEVSDTTVENTTTITVFNPPDMPDKHALMVKAAQEQAFNT